MKKYTLFVFLLFHVSIYFASAQIQNSHWMKLYADTRLTVEIQYLLSDSACADQGIPNQIRYKVTGNPSRSPEYVCFTFEYRNCNNTLKYQTYSIPVYSEEVTIGIVRQPTDYTFDGNLENAFKDVHLSKDSKQESGTRIRPLSTAATGVVGITDIYYGQNTQLMVTGGELGTGAKWVWYEKQCSGQSVGTGNKLSVSPKDNTMYYVRAEGTNNVTNCASVEVKVDKRSLPPTGINADNSICEGELLTLTVEGGHLGMNAEWKWYEGSCSVGLIGKGESIQVRPDKSTTYFVRAEGTVNVTTCRFHEVKVITKINNPGNILSSSGNSSICEGESVNLTLIADNLNNGEIWKWYSGSCNGRFIGSGTHINIKPIESTTYYVRAEGICNTTQCVSCSVKVINKSIKPNHIIIPLSVYKRVKTKLEISGGKLGTGAEWKWYKGACLPKGYIGTGEAIYVRAKKPVTYYVKAIGACNETDCISTTIIPLKSHRFDKYYNNRKNKFLQLGLGLGMEWINSPVWLKYQYNSNGLILTDSLQQNINGLGLKTEFTFSPFMKNHLSAGLVCSYSAGLAPSVINGGEKLENSTIMKESYFYSHINFEVETALGLKSVKLLAKFSHSLVLNDYEKKKSDNNSVLGPYIYNDEVYREKIHAGFRFGRYSSKVPNHRNSFIDLTYILSHPGPSSFLGFEKEGFKYLPEWNSGFEFSWWQQSGFHLQFCIQSDIRQKYLKLSEVGTKNLTYQLSLIFSRNWFY